MTQNQKEQRDTEIERLRSVIRMKHYSYATEDNYVQWLKRYIGFLLSFGHRELPAERKFEAFLSHLANNERVSASTQNQAFNAIRFYYENVRHEKLGDIKALRAKRPAHMRTAPTRSQVREILRRVQDVHGYPTRLISFLLYGCGLRVSEPLNLRIKDVDVENSRLFIRDAKGGKDRVVSLSCKLTNALIHQMKIARTFWEYDKANGIPVAMPGLLGKRHKNAGFYWQWYWVFPSRKPCVCRRSGATVRFRCHEANVQKAVRAAASQVELEGVVTPHNLRHSYATHLLDAGAKMTAVASAMGHQSIETTAGYDHSEPLSVPSPLDLVDRPNWMATPPRQVEDASRRLEFVSATQV
jgi:integron integrase